MLRCAASKIRRLRLTRKLSYLPGRPVLIDRKDLDLYVENNKCRNQPRPQARRQRHRRLLSTGRKTGSASASQCQKHLAEAKRFLGQWLLMERTAEIEAEGIAANHRTVTRLSRAQAQKRPQPSHRREPERQSARPFRCAHRAAADPGSRRQLRRQADIGPSRPQGQTAQLRQELRYLIARTFGPNRGTGRSCSIRFVPAIRHAIQQRGRA